MKTFLKTLVFLVLGWSSTGFAEIYVKIPGVPGEVKTDQYEGAIEAFSVSGDFSQQGGCGDFVITKSLDSSSPLLMAAAISGQLYTEVEVDFVSNSQNTGLFEFVRYLLRNATVISLSTTSTTGENTPLPAGIAESLVLRPQSIAMRYTPRDDTGRPLNPVQQEVQCRGTERV